MSTPELQQGQVQHQPGHGRYTALERSSLHKHNTGVQMGPALVTLCAVLSILSPHHDCGHTKVAPDPEIAPGTGGGLLHDLCGEMFYC